MSIHDRRLEVEINKIIKKNLEDGYVPTANEVIGQLSRFLVENNLNLPTFQYKKVTKGLTASAVNKAKKEVAQDVETLFGSLIELYQLAEDQIHRFSVEKKKYDYRLAKLESKLTSLIGQHSTDGYLLGYMNSFSDMDTIDLSMTDADIDIFNQEATLKRLSDVPYRNFTASVSSEASLLLQSGKIGDIVNTEGIAWQGIIEKDTQEKTTLTLIIDAKEITKLNRLNIDMPMLKKCEVVVSTSPDGDKWNEEYKATIVDRCSTGLSGQTRYVKVEISKTEADKYHLGKYQYYYIVQDIQLDSINYTLESNVVSKPIKAGININKISLFEESEMPPSTSIEYYVAASSESPVWIPISPVNSKNRTNPTMIAFNTVETDQRISISIPQEISNNAYELKNYSVNGQRLFAIAELEGIDLTNHKLYKGINAWKVQSLTATVSGPQTQSLFLDNSALIKVEYTPIVEDKSSLVVANKSFTENKVLYYSTNIYREAGDINFKEIIASSHPITVYLNGKIVYSGTPSSGVKADYQFHKGQNLLEVIVNIPSTPTVCSVDLNLPLLAIGSQICANANPMKQVSLFDLRYNTNNQTDVYTVYTIDRKHSVIVKDSDLAIRYDFIYDYIVDPIEEILIKATLKREHASVDISPRLISYEVRFI